jgi:hypothetical protein
MMCDDDWALYQELFNFSSITISYGVNLYLDLWNVNKFNSIQFNEDPAAAQSVPFNWSQLSHGCSWEGNCNNF